MRQETAQTVNQVRGLAHEPSHQLVVRLLRQRLADLKDQLIDVDDATWKQVQGQARECRWMLHQLTGEHPRKPLAS